jgi:desulfoferrodoxin (superoxide reductase-like protein)
MWYIHKPYIKAQYIGNNQMPAISMFYGIIVYLYFRDNKQHHVPHIHVKYQEHEVVVTIPEGEVLEGSIPRAKMKLLQAWVELHKDELVADWELAVSGQQPYKIEPLR